MSNLNVSSGVSRILSGDDALNPTTLKVYRKRYDEYQTFCASSGDELKEEEHLLEFFNKKHETIGELRPWFSAINHFFKTVNGGTTMQAKYPSLMLFLVLRCFAHRSRRMRCQQVYGIFQYFGASRGWDAAKLMPEAVSDVANGGILVTIDHTHHRNGPFWPRRSGSRIEGLWEVEEEGAAGTASPQDDRLPSAGHHINIIA